MKTRILLIEKKVNAINFPLDAQMDTKSFGLTGNLSAAAAAGFQSQTFEVTLNFEMKILL